MKTPSKAEKQHVAAGSAGARDGRLHFDHLRKINDIF